MTELREQDLSIHERINLRGLLQAWTDIAIERFQKEQMSKVYGLRTNRKNVSRSMLGRTYRFGSRNKNKRTYNLRNAWHQQVRLSDVRNSVRLEFLQYGRFVDMGVGRGLDIHEAKWNRNRRNGETVTREPKRWYAKRKGFETHRLRELLTRYHVNVPIELLENSLSGRLTLNV